MIMDFLTDDCDICNKKCFDKEQEIMECDGCNENYHVCLDCFKKDSCDSCDEFFCPDCQEDGGYELRGCDDDRCCNEEKYCDECRNHNLGYCQGCEEHKCCVKVFRTIDSELNYNYSCEKCLECVFNP